jgi:mRNA-degrading endonuclease RelE of RelBE toxin-antitoxin system
MAKRVIFSDEARADIRAIDRETALRLLKALARFLETEAGNVKQLEGSDPPQFRLRIGDWRYIFRRSGEDVSRFCASGIGGRLTAERLRGGTENQQVNVQERDAPRKSLIFLRNQLAVKTFAYANAPFAYANPSWGEVSPLLPPRRRRLLPVPGRNPGLGPRKLDRRPNAKT